MDENVLTREWVSVAESEEKEKMSENINANGLALPWYKRIETFVVTSTLVVIVAFFSWAFSDTDRMGEAMNTAFIFWCIVFNTKNYNIVINVKNVFF